jgi:hypothetical protein
MDTSRLISLISLMRTWNKALEILQLVLAALDFILELRQRRGVALLGLDVLVEPARAGLVLRERRNEVLARHARLLDAEEHDFALEQAHLGDVLAQIVDQLVEHLRRELQLHQFGADLLADLQRLRILRAQLVERVQILVVYLADRSETLGRLFGIGAGIDGLLLLIAIRRLFIIVGGFLALERHHFRILRLRDLIGRIRIDETDDHIDEAHLSGLHRFIVAQQQLVCAGIAAERDLDGLETFFDALGDADFALARQQFDGAHFAHVHAHRIGGAAELGIEIGESGGGFLDGFFVGGSGGIRQQQRFGIRRLLVHRNPHVVDHVDDVFDLFRIDDLARQMIVDFGVGEVALLLAARNQ